MRKPTTATNQPQSLATKLTKTHSPPCPSNRSSPFVKSPAAKISFSRNGKTRLHTLCKFNGQRLRFGMGGDDRVRTQSLERRADAGLASEVCGGVVCRSFSEAFAGWFCVGLAFSGLASNCRVCGVAGVCANCGFVGCSDGLGDCLWAKRFRGWRCPGAFVAADFPRGGGGSFRLAAAKPRGSAGSFRLGAFCVFERLRSPPGGNEGEVPEYPGVPNLPPETQEPPPPDFPDDHDEINGDVWSGDYLSPKDGYFPNAPAWDYFIHEKDGQFEQIMMHYCAAYRGIHPISDKSNYEINRTAFDFQRFFTTQYLFAPARFAHRLSCVDNHVGRSRPAVCGWRSNGACRRHCGTSCKYRFGYRDG